MRRVERGHDEAPVSKQQGGSVLGAAGAGLAKLTQRGTSMIT